MPARRSRPREARRCLDGLRIQCGRGVAWLTEGTVAAYGRTLLTPIGGDKWALAFIFSRIQGFECMMVNGH